MSNEKKQAEQLYQRGHEALRNKEFEKMMEFYEQAAKMGNPDAMCDLGMWLFEGISFDSGAVVTNKTRDTKRAFQLIQQAYEIRMKENDDASFEMTWLGKMYRYGRGTKKDLQKAVDFLTRAASLGNHEASRLLGDMYAKGIGVGVDEKRAAELYEKAVAKDNDDFEEEDFRVILALGEMYAHGVGVSVDGAKAVKWYEKAASPENISHSKRIKAMQALAKMYDDGINIKQDMEKAADWRKKEAEYEREYAQKVYDKRE